MKLTKEKNYKSLMNAPKQRIKEGQIKAVLSANSELLRLYWDIGLKIASEQKQKGWGAKRAHDKFPFSPHPSR